MGTLGGGIVALTAAARATGRRPPEPGVRDVLLLGVATHKLSRLLAKDSVTSPMRAPFTRFQGADGDAELREEVRGQGGRKAVGELVSCPFCLAPWVVTALSAGLTFAPRWTRAVVASSSAVAVSDFLQLAYAGAQQRSTPPEERAAEAFDLTGTDQSP